MSLIAVLGAAALVLAGGGVPKPTPAGSVAQVTPVITATAAVASSADESSVEPTLQAMQRLSTLVTCAGEPCPSEGPSDAPITLIEISDFTCTHCAHFNLESEPVLKAKYVEKGLMRYVSHVFAFNDVSRQIAAAAMCAHEQGGYSGFKREAFDAQSVEAPDKADYLSWAEAVGLDLDTFGRCVDEQRYVAQVEASTSEALAAGIAATPSFVLNGLLTEGNPVLDEYMALIDKALAAAGGGL